MFTILLLGTTGQIAWLLENNWFNTFVYDEITTDPAPIAWMVAVSAIVATLTTLIMGTVSAIVATLTTLIMGTVSSSTYSGGLSL